MAKFQPLAGNTYSIYFEYDKPRHNDATDKYSESWSYGVHVDAGSEMLYWNVYSPNVKATIDSMGILKGLPIQMTVAQEMGKSGKPHNTYHFIKDNKSYYSQATQAQPTQSQPVSAKKSAKMTLDDLDELMFQCWQKTDLRFPGDALPIEEKVKWAISMAIGAGQKGIVAEVVDKQEVKEEHDENQAPPPDDSDYPM